MPPLDLAIHFLGGAFLANAVPHFVHGISGHRFQTPFAKPPARGESSPIVNLLWAAFNLAAGWALVHLHRGPGGRPLEDQLAIAAGGFAMALVLGWHFGKVRGGGVTPGDTLGH